MHFKKITTPGSSANFLSPERDGQAFNLYDSLVSFSIIYRKSTMQSKRNTIDFDEILEHVGGWGIFQWKLTGVLMITTFVLSYVAFSPILYMYTPDHWCNIPQNYSDLLQISNQTNLEILEGILIPIDKVTKEKSQCFMYDPNSIDDAMSANRSKWQTIKCMHGWQYNFTGYYSSISTKVSFKLGFSQIRLGTSILKFDFLAVR